MKKIILGIFIGILMCKISVTIYSYYWNKDENLISCMKEIHIGQCVEKNMGIIIYLKYFNMNLVKLFNGWTLNY